jgi:NAD(P)-dependent dehydrogenase (short-subunit alcohol dehydrogenase family)
VRLLGKTAIVTGGAEGIGQGIVLRLAEEGADIVIADINAAAAGAMAKKVEQMDRRALAVAVDVSRRDQVENLVKRAQDLGRIDILVNNAGIERITPLLEIEEDDWRRILDINLKGTFLCSQAVAKAMIQDQCGGKIVNLGSVAGVRPPRQEPHYAASKGGVHALTKQLALELAPHQINVNAVAPGPVRNGLGSRHSLADPIRAEQIAQRIPLGRVGTPRDVANAVMFLASAEADYITGVVLPVEGGRLLL